MTTSSSRRGDACAGGCTGGCTVGRHCRCVGLGGKMEIQMHC